MELLCIAMFVSLGGGCIACLVIKKPTVMIRIPVVAATLCMVIAVLIAIRFFTLGTYCFFGENLLIDSLSLYHILLVNTVFLVAAVYATGYFKQNETTETNSHGNVKRYSMLWLAFQGFLLLVLMSNNIGLMWIAIEATTLVSAFLIITETESLSVEAMWKYLLICSIGIVFAFMGTILTVAAASELDAGIGGHLFSHLIEHPEAINPQLMLLAFILIAVGFGTKAGLSPMHTWLPDAHSQAPTPVSAVFSGVMLNCALFCIMRYLPITEAALGWDGQAHEILLLFGCMSLVFAAVFIPIQSDVKRFLAYCSVEHIGIIAVGLGLGGFGAFVALLHTTNHSLAKVLAFFSAGHIGKRYGTRDMRHISGAVHQTPWWGMAFFISMLVLIGVAPFSVFLSELLLLKEAFFTKHYLLFVLFSLTVFAVFVSSLKHLLGVSFGNCSSEKSVHEPVRSIDKATIIVCIMVLLLLGVWIPSPFTDFLKGAAAIVENGVRL